MAPRSAPAAGDEPPPEPPADLARRTLRTYPLASTPRDDAPLPAGAALWRIHDPTLGSGNPRWYGPAAGEPPRNRFDDPHRASAAARPTFGVCYTGATREAAFAETLLRKPALRFVDLAAVRGRSLAQLAATRPLRLIALLGPGLAAAGATAAVPHGPHSVARRWARALWAHPLAADGIAYRCRHDDGEVAVALFDRAADALAVVESRPLGEDRLWLAATLDRYGLSLDTP